MRFKRLIHRSLEFNMVFSINGVYLVAQTVKNLPTMQETQVQSLSWENPLDFGYFPAFLPGEFLIGLISLQSKGLSSVFSNITVQKPPQNNFKILLLPEKSQEIRQILCYKKFRQRMTKYNGGWCWIYQ